MRNNLPRPVRGGKWLLLLSFALLARESFAQESPTNSPTKAMTKQVVIFRNGDLLLGNLESIGSDKSVVWKRNDVLQPIEFDGTNISEIQFAAAQKRVTTATNTCRIELNNGDSIEGALLQLNSEKITLETAFAGKMVFPRKVVAALEPLPPERQPIFSGPTGLEGWTIGKVTAIPGEAGEWKYTNGAFYAGRSASIARELNLPDMASIQFDLGWKGQLQVAVALYTSYMQPVNLQNKDTEPDFGGFYSLQINSFMASLMPVKKNDALKYLGQIPVPAFSQKDHAHIEIRANKSRASVALFADGVLVKEWIDADGFAGTGTGMRFVHQGGQGAVKVSHLRISEWNGKMDDKSTNAPVKEDLAKLLNGDTVSGTLETYRDGKLTFATAKTKLDIPFARIDKVLLVDGNGKGTAENALTVRAFFNETGSVTFRLERWDAQGVIGTSPNFGRATFAPATFERVQLNPNLRKNSE
ncbi:MAG: hypothetical protein ABIP71_00900 [Verrucomicrobiota bacterium]